VFLTHEEYFEIQYEKKGLDSKKEKEKYITHFLDNLKKLNFEIFQKIFCSQI